MDDGGQTDQYRIWKCSEFTENRGCGQPPVKRMVQSVRGTRSLIDATQGRKTKAVIVTSDDYLVLSALQPETIARRFAEIYEYEDKGEVHE